MSRHKSLVRSLIVFLAALCSRAGAVVAVDQVGYIPDASKYVFTTQAADSFFVSDIITSEIHFRGPLEIWRPFDGATGSPVRRGDFSPFQRSGTYRISVAGGETSEPFSIADTVYNQVYRKALRGYFFQRCGSELRAANAGVYQHPACHLLDGVFHPSADTSGYRITTGGWHDAGDYGKYVVNAGVTVGTLLMGYEYFSEKFNQDDLNIPGSGNGIPDILDEVRYELAWLLTMQGEDGGVYFKVTHSQFEGFIMPQNDGGARYIYQVSSTATADFAAVMARGARVYQAFDTTFAQACSLAAVRAWSYLTAHPTIVPSGGFRNPTGTSTGEYGDGSDSDERLWAAAELFVTTGDELYNAYFIFYYGASGIFGSAMSWQNVRSLAHLTYMKSQQPTTDEPIRSQLRDALISYCQSQVSKRNTSGYHVLLQPGEYTWGSNASPLNSAILMIMGYTVSQTSLYNDIAADQLHYVLGANALNFSFVTGVGSRSPRQPHHRPSASDGIPDPVPGLLVGGPDQYRDDPLLRALFTASTPPALCYVDSLPSYASNEVAINWNAPLVFLAGYFNSPRSTHIDDDRPFRLNFNMQLHQNYPNPFNASTQISFTLEERDDIEFSVVDLLGRTVLRKPIGSFPPGENSFWWQAHDETGTPLSSGVYWYFLQGKHRSDVRKLILLN